MAARIGNMNENYDCDISVTMKGGTDTRPQFGNRYLTDKNSVFEHNAWDNVEWSLEQEAAAQERVSKNSEVRVPEFLQEKYETEAFEYWNKFYGIHQNRFFKDRHWLFTEFPELAPQNTEFPLRATSLKNNLRENSQSGYLPTPPSSISQRGLEPAREVDREKNLGNKSVLSNVQTDNCDSKLEFPGAGATTRILEVGCGAGNTVFPILEVNNDQGLFVYCCDFSDAAVSLVKKHEKYEPQRCYAFTCDVTTDVWPVPFPEESLDVIVLIFVLSAIHPNKMQHVINTLGRYLKPGGQILFRDYGRYDMAELRFKSGCCLQDHFYVRGDGTRVYFFTEGKELNKTLQ
ncbi:methyltransferase-like protein 2-A [Limulus polyphemus]|uniref:tRNA N(3)-methylcytidine methyltransferase n=1 Tax=Limulus polyphemus TaxID=6850 RepID=A0ABM1C0M2_LIMPO|nr:methyltransferase-like protein 2-A [Limulus polyphemus]